jgi:RNA polymerase sigma-70 factor (ECF subfamily)
MMIGAIGPVGKLSPQSYVPIREKIMEIARALPAAPRVFARLDRLMRDEHSSLDEISALIKSDAALTGQLIRVSNSVVYGGERKVGSVEEAVARVGLQELYRLVGYMAGAHLADQALKQYGIKPDQLREHMVRTAFVSEQLAMECGMDPRLAYTAGLLRSIGLFVCDRLAGQYQAAPAYQPGHDHDYLTWEGRLFGIGSCEVGAWVLEEWKFPADIVEAVRWHYLSNLETNEQRLACVLNLACGLVAAHGYGLPGEKGHWARPQAKLDALGLSEKRFQAAEARAGEAFAGFHRRFEGKADPAPAAPATLQTKTEVSPENCDLDPATGVLEVNDDPTVHTTQPEVTPQLDFTTFMRNYQNMVYSTAVRLIGNETQAEDIAQEVFLKAYEHFDNLRASPTAGGWLKTVATNLSINHIQRYKKRWRFFSDLGHKDDEGGEKEVEFAAPDTFYGGVDSAERREWVERALEKLPEHQRVPLMLFHFEDMPYDEIARKLRVSLSKVKTDILRGREALARILVHSGAPHETFQL